MRNKNWIEFTNEQNNDQTLEDETILKNSQKIEIFTQKKGKKGKIITIIQGLHIKNQTKKKEFFKSIKVFCGTGGKLNNESIQLQGDMVEKITDFLLKEGYQI